MKVKITIDSYEANHHETEYNSTYSGDVDIRCAKNNRALVEITKMKNTINGLPQKITLIVSREELKLALQALGHEQY